MGEQPLAETGESWFRAELARAKRRNALLPRSARPVVRLRRTPEPTGCHCGHPGAGCICYPPGQHPADHTPRAEQGGES